MKDNRVFRTEQLTEDVALGLAQGVELYSKIQEEKDRAKREEIEKKIKTGELIRKDGKLYDARYYKG